MFHLKSDSGGSRESIKEKTLNWVLALADLNSDSVHIETDNPGQVDHTRVLCFLHCEIVSIQSSKDDEKFTSEIAVDKW